MRTRTENKAVIIVEEEECAGDEFVIREVDRILTEERDRSIEKDRRRDEYLGNAKTMVKGSSLEQKIQHFQDSPNLRKSERMDDLIHLDGRAPSRDHSPTRVSPTGQTIPAPIHTSSFEPVNEYPLEERLMRVNFFVPLIKGNQTELNAIPEMHQR